MRFQKHILRTLWQINEWQQVTEYINTSKDVTNYGWLIEYKTNYTLIITMNSQL